MLPIIMAAVQAAQSMESQNKAKEAEQRQQMAGLYGQQQSTPLQQFATQNPQIDPKMFADLFLKKKQQAGQTEVQPDYQQGAMLPQQAPALQNHEELPKYLTMPQYGGDAYQR